MNNFRAIADEIAADISSGLLAPGTRLLPQRAFANQRGIAASTASRVYAELARLGLTTGEVGRGTYVRSALASSHPVLSEPAFAPIDLEMNIPLLTEASTELARILECVAQADALGHALKPIGAAATQQARKVVASFVARGNWKPDESGIFFTGNGRQAIAAAMRTLAAPGGRIGVEAMTYPVVKGIARQLGIALVPLDLDDKGLIPSAIVDAHRATPLSGIYLQPSLHNPMGCTMDVTRRQDIGAALAQSGLIAIEDAIYGFLVDEEPLAAYAPDQVIYVESFSKRIAPGLTFGFALTPSAVSERFASAVRSAAVASAGFPLAVGLQLISDGAAQRIAAFKRDDAAARQRIAREVLSGLDLVGDPRAFHLWLKLPSTWRAETFIVAAARRGIAIAPGSAFAVSSGHAPNAVRIALSAPPRKDLQMALQALRRLVEDGDAEID